MTPSSFFHFTKSCLNHRKIPELETSLIFFETTNIQIKYQLYLESYKSKKQSSFVEPILLNNVATCIYHRHMQIKRKA